MKWGRKKKKPPLLSSSSSHSSSSCSRPSLISHVFPSSWLSKFKPKSKKSEPKPGKIGRKGKQNCPSLGSPRWDGNGGGRFYGVDDDDDDAFWRLSFGEDSAEVKNNNNNRGVLRSVWYDSEEELEVEKSSCGGCKTSGGKMEGRGGSQKLKGMHKSGKDKEWKLGNPNRGVLELEREADEKNENDVLEMLAAREHHYVPSMNARNSSLTTIEEESLNSEMEDEEEEQISDWKKLKAKSEKQRKSIYIRRELPRRRRTKRSCKVRVCSPRTASRVEICKLKTLEDVMKKAANERAVQQVRTGLNSFAVVKCSYDPQQDFRESMVEMIVEKKITQPEDLEELLACYLTLNSDEYHDLIIKVFRQVWFELNQVCFGTETAEGTM